MDTGGPAAGGTAERYRCFGCGARLDAAAVDPTGGPYTTAGDVFTDDDAVPVQLVGPRHLFADAASVQGPVTGYWCGPVEPEPPSDTVSPVG